MPSRAPDDSQSTARTAFLRLAAPRNTLAAAAVLLATYVATMARDLSFFDSGELALAAVTLGLGHPPGQPLHTLVGFALAHVPFVAPLVGVVLASALPAALTLVPATSLAESLVPAEPDSTALARARLALPWGLALLALHPALWEPATRVEVYALATFFAVWAAAKLADGSRPRAVFAAAVALGLCASANPMIAACTAIAVGPALLMRIARRELPASVLVLALAGGALGLVPYVYVPLVAHRTDTMVWGAPRTAEQLWSYFTLRDYRHNQTIGLATWLEHLVAWAVHSFERGLGGWLVLGVGAHLGLGARSRLGRLAGPLLVLLLASFVAFNVVWNLEVPDYDGYLASGLWLVGAGAAAACVRVAAHGRIALSGLLAALLVASTLLAQPQPWARTRHRDRAARILAEGVLRSAPRDALVITYSDTLAAPLFYLQGAEGQRGDVVVLAYGLASSSWHWQHIAALHPELELPLRGPGGRAGRVRRVIEAQRDRPVLVESLALAAELGLQACPFGLYLGAATTCELPAASTSSAEHTLARAIESAGDGSPSAASAIAERAYVLGESLWRLGEPAAAYRALLAGVPSHLRPRARLAPSAGVERLPVLAPCLPPWRRASALGDPGRNLFVAGCMLHGAGDEAGARELLQAAARTGLPEAFSAR